ncbi:alpha/beta hydrolase fold domain-containing protein [Streptomyces sp. NPDC093252]|uniref:alpha/beta hydrolase fold domain-containing protein n=1 Tax=Streptomyces sp. NPDC093252 TaxID=3154980 RepID=UPI003436122D
MPLRDPHIDRSAAFQALLMQALSHVFVPLVFSSRQLQFASEPTAKPTTEIIPTRHGKMRALVYAPTARQMQRHTGAGMRPPVHLAFHPGAFIGRRPQQEDNVARYLASDVGCYVVLPDYGVAPQVRFPVAEEQSYDAYHWVHKQAAHAGWDRNRISVGGGSVGGRLALNVALMAIDHDYHRPAAVSAEYPFIDTTREDGARTSAKKRPLASPSLMSLVRRTYFAGVDPHHPLAALVYHPRRGELPPTLIMTAEYDTLRHEGNDFAVDLAARGVEVTHREFPGVDHQFTHTKPTESARAAIHMIGDHLSRAYTESAVE